MIAHCVEVLRIVYGKSNYVVTVFQMYRSAQLEVKERSANALVLNIGIVDRNVYSKGFVIDGIAVDADNIAFGVDGQADIFGLQSKNDNRFIRLAVGMNVKGDRRALD